MSVEPAFSVSVFQGAFDPLFRDCPLKALLFYLSCVSDLDLSHMEDEAYDYKFVKWMIKEKVCFIIHLNLHMHLNTIGSF